MRKEVKQVSRCEENRGTRVPGHRENTLHCSPKACGKENSCLSPSKDVDVLVTQFPDGGMCCSYTPC